MSLFRFSGKIFFSPLHMHSFIEDGNNSCLGPLWFRSFFFAVFPPRFDTLGVYIAIKTTYLLKVIDSLQKS